MDDERKQVTSSEPQSSIITTLCHAIGRRTTRIFTGSTQSLVGHTGKKGSVTFNTCGEIARVNREEGHCSQDRFEDHGYGNYRAFCLSLGQEQPQSQTRVLFC